MSDAQARPFLIVLAILFAVIAGWYAQITPYRTSGKLVYQRGAPAQDIGAPDERQHVNYIDFVRTEKKFPVFNPQDPNLYESYQSHQPPLFYTVAAISGLQGQALRFLNVLIGIFSVVGLYAFGKAVTGRAEIGLGCAAFSLMPMFAALHGAVSNDPLLFCFLTWTLVFCVRGLRNDPCPNCWLYCALFFGLALYTKTSAWAIAPSVILSAAWFARNQSVSILRRVVIPIGVVLLMVSPLWIRNTLLYGDPMAMKVFKEAFGGTAQASDFIVAVGPVGYWMDWVTWWTSRSFIGVFGYMDIFLPNNAYLLAWAFLFLMACGWLLSSKQSEKVECVSGSAASSLLFLALVLGLFLMFNKTYFQGQARYLYPAVAVWAILIGGGAARLHPKFGWAGLAGVLLVTNGYILTWLPAEFSRRLG